MGFHDDQSADVMGEPASARPAGLLEKLMAVIRPEFRADVLVFDPRDPVSGGPPCADHLARLAAIRPPAGDRYADMSPLNG